MAKSAKRRRPPSAQHRAALAQPLVDAVVGGPDRVSAGEDLDIAPLLVALHVGALDQHLPEIARVVNDRLAAIEAVEELLASSRLHVGDKVRLGHNLRPNYLHGRAATIVAKDGEKWIVRLDGPPAGKYANADLRLYATQLETALGT